STAKLRFASDGRSFVCARMRVACWFAMSITSLFATPLGRHGISSSKHAKVHAASRLHAPRRLRPKCNLWICIQCKMPPAGRGFATAQSAGKSAPRRACTRVARRAAQRLHQRRMRHAWQAPLSTPNKESDMGKYFLAWLLGVPAGLLVLIYVFTHL